MTKEDTRFLAVCFVVFATTISCGEKKFEKERWTAKTDANFPSQDREKMLSDLLSNHKLVGMKYSDVINLLGSPDGTDSSSLCYEIEIDYGSDIDPVYTKNLCLFTTQDSVISSYKIDEWKKE